MSASTGSADPGQTGIGSSCSSSLPPEKVFTVQIGCEVFKLSGSSIASDAPSYFSQFFEDQLRQQNDDGAPLRTLYIDRDPATFRDISLHLQGYHVRPRDGPHFVKLFADAQFYSLPRLMSQLFESEIFIQIGDRHFQVPRNIFSGPGDSPNFFSLGFAMFFVSPNEVFPGLDRKNLLRPPAISPPIVSNRSGDTFAEVLHLLRGYPIHIRNEDHRAELLRDCRYYHLRGLEQKLIPHQIGYDMQRQKAEIVLRLEDIRQSGIEVVDDDELTDTFASAGGGWVHYARPFVDDTARELIVETGADCMTIDVDPMTAEVHGSAGEKITKLVGVAASKLQEKMTTTNPEESDSKAGAGAGAGDRVAIHFDGGSDVVVDGRAWTGRTRPRPRPHDIDIEQPPAKRLREDDGGTGTETRAVAVRWLVRSGQWRLRVFRATPGQHGPGHGNAPAPVRAVLVAAKVDAVSGQRERNARRAFLGS